MADKESTSNGAPGDAYIPGPDPAVERLLEAHAADVDVGALRAKGLKRIRILTVSKIQEMVSRAVLDALERFRAAREREDSRGGSTPAGAAAGDDPQDEPPAQAALEDAWRECLGILEEGVRAAVARALSMSAPGGAPPASLEREIQGACAAVLRGASGPIVEAFRQASDRRSGILERRIGRLKRTLAETEGSLKIIAAAKGIDLGLPSLYREVQDLGLDAADMERKRKMLQAILDENLELQKAGGHE